MILIDTQKEEFSKLRDIRVFGRISHDDRFNGNLLVVGLGGVGSRTVCNLKGMMVDDIIPEDNIHFLMIQTFLRWNRQLRTAKSMLVLMHLKY